MSETLRNLLYQENLAVRWGDMDALGHINNATYFTYFEQCRCSWLETINRSDSVGGNIGDGPVLLNATANFHLPLVFPAKVIVTMYGGVPGRSSFNSYYEIREADNTDNLYTTGEAKIVWVDHRTGKSIPVPDDIRALLPNN
ncbi:thioesterase family protein [Microbulbifer sp. MLAF003]|uniref:acyl-CoA thioesterase n=1 Tax=unclassified Microbulbifer TaxID=2619833 RepID=UPI0024AD40F8|nr:thioesterase family protein [Microbulbifer sp. MLAF003]WHI51409.1 thioesterase family protein [Microbulbifer sp. MLAF003]